MSARKSNLAEAVRTSLRLLDRRDRRLLGAAIAAQMSTSLLDLVGVILLGVVGALAVSAGNGQAPPAPVERVVSAVGLGGSSDATAIILLAASAALLLLAKSTLSIVLLRRVYRFLARQETMLSARLTRALLSQPLTFLQRRSSQQTASGLIQGANAATIMVLGQTVVAAAEIALLTVLSVALFAVNPVIALGAVLFFAAIGGLLQKGLGQRNADFASQRRQADVSTSIAIQETIGAYREITVAHRRSLYVNRLHTLRNSAAEAAAGSQLIGMMPKFVSEVALVVGASALAGILFMTQPIPVAAGTFAMFLAAATRAMPSLLRLQSAALQIRFAGAWANSAATLAEDLASSGADLHMPQPEDTGSAPGPDGDFVPRITLRDITFSYDGNAPALRGIDITVTEGQSVALVGRSGAGKSTLADVILGVLEPDTGEVLVGGVRPMDAVARWPGMIAYVPQDVMLSDDTLRANVALGIPTDRVDDAAVWDALRAAHLEQYVHTLPDGLETQIGERGLRLSGGQRQRLGIARALYTGPRLLVLDEATSALDAETEQTITAMLEDLEHHVTTVIIAHRLSTVRHADLVVYLGDGRTMAAGTFDEVCEQVPALRRQADLMGLRPT